jgi:atypical dual specificity phosphatase
MRATYVRRLVMILKSVGLVVDRGDWLVPNQVLACAYPRRQASLAALAQQGVTVMINLHQRAHRPARLGLFGLTEIHLPVADFTAPSPEQLAAGVDAIAQAVADGRRVAVHCGGGLGRTGTLLACYLVRQGLSATDAIERVRAVRPGSIETRQQIQAVHTYEQVVRQQVSRP